MSKSIRLLVALGILAGVAACAQPPVEPEPTEFVVVDPEPISVEPMVHTGKF